MLRKCALCLLLALVALAAPIAVRADSPPQPIPAGGKCAVPVDPNWTKQEQFVWLNVCVGKEADFNKEPGYGGDLDPKNPTGMPESRILRSSFLETILLKDKYRSALTRLGVRIIGARFTETVDLRNAELQHELWLDRSLLENGVNLETAETSRRITLDGSKILGVFDANVSQINKDLSMRGTEFSETIYLLGAHIGGHLSLNSSTVTGMLNMNGIRVDRGLFMGDKTRFKEIDLTSAHIGETLDLRNSTVDGMLNMNAIRVDQGLLMRDQAQFKEIDLRVAHIGETLDLRNSTVNGTLNMNAIRVGQGLFMSDMAQFKEINLASAHIGGQLILSDSTVAGMLNMTGIDVDQDLLMGNKANFAGINLAFAHIGGILSLIDSTVTGTLAMTGIRVDQHLLMGHEAQFKEINLAAAHISGVLGLGTSTVTGKFESNYINVEGLVSLGSGATFKDEINLRSAKLGQDLYLSGGSFSKNVDLTGTQVGGILGLESTQWLGSAILNLTNASVGAIDLSHNWPHKIYLNGLTYHNLSNLAGNFSREQAENWFGKQAYAPQPYQQLANVLQANGRIKDATEIRYAGKERERRAASGLNWAWLVLLNYTIGFGYHLEFAFYWAVGLVLLGWAVLYSTGQRTKHKITLGLAYSFDMLLPLVQLRKRHYDMELDPWPRRYFFAHKIVGVILSSFLVAGISGLTK